MVLSLPAAARPTFNDENMFLATTRYLRRESGVSEGVTEVAWVVQGGLSAYQDIPCRRLPLAVNVIPNKLQSLEDVREGSTNHTITRRTSPSAMMEPKKATRQHHNDEGF